MTPTWPRQGARERLLPTLAVLAMLGVAACSDTTAPTAFERGTLSLSVVGPEAVSDAEVAALGSAFDRVDRYDVTIVDSGTLDLIAEVTLTVAPNLEQHVLDVAIPETAFGRSVAITLVAFDGALELYRSMTETTLGDDVAVVSVDLEIRYTGPGLRGQITDAKGDGVGGVSVNLSQDQAIVDAVGTEPDGTYLFLDLDPGSYRLSPTPLDGQVACPGLRDVTIGSAQDAIVSDFEVVDGNCGTSVLVLSGGDVDDTEAVATILEGDPSLSVSTFFFVSQLPTPDFLAQHDVVLLFMNGLFDESTSLGTRVADYVSGGGNVVTASFYWQGRSDGDKGSTGWGTLETIDPLTSTGGATYRAAALGEVSAHPLTDDVVTLTSSGYRGGAAAKSDAVVVASWDDGTPLVAYRVLAGGQRVVGVTLFPGCCSTGDSQVLWQNAVRWAGSGERAQQASAWVDLAVGAAHSCGLLEDGRAYCWGRNDFGQLGRPDLPAGPTPRLSTAAYRFSGIEATGNTTCALTQDGTAYCWGENTLGQVGSGSTEVATTAPEEVVGGPWARIAMGVLHACALDAAGAAYCWGGGGSQDALRDLALGFDPPDSCITGQAYYSERCSRTPRPVETSVRFADISPGLFTTCAVAQDATAYCWGSADYGQLGIGPYSSTDARFTPQAVAGTTTFRSVSGGGLHMCGVSLSDQAYCWGGTMVDALGLVTSGFDAGQVGQGGTPGSSPPAPAPAPVVGGLSIASVSASTENSVNSMFTCGLTPTGAAYCWGRDSEGELGGVAPPPVCDQIAFGPAPCTTSPLPVQGGHTFVELEAGLSFACALTGDGRIFCWGANESGQRGDANLTSSPVPTEVPVPGAGPR